MTEHIADIKASRFYENRYPLVDELVMFRITRIENMGAYGELLEYGNVEGMLLLSELSKRRFRSVAKLIKIGRVEVCMVIRVDEDKGYIDLSKKRVAKEDMPECEERYSRAKKVQLTARHVASEFDLSIDFLNKEVMWPLYRKYGDALNGLMALLTEGRKIFDFVDKTQISEDILDAIMKDIHTRLAPSASKTRCIFETTCSGRRGVNAVKDAIMEGMQASEELFKPTANSQNSDLLVRLIAPPRFIATCTDSNVELAMQRLQKLIEVTQKAILAIEGGGFSVFEDVRVQGDEEEPFMQQSSEEYEDTDSQSDLEGMGDVQE